MTITVFGATGVLGRRVVARLVADGHEVRGLARSDDKRALLTGLGAEPLILDVFDTRAVARAAEGSEGVINLMTHIPEASRMAWPAAWAENDRLRRAASAAIAAGARAAGARRLVQESVCFVYADGRDRWLDEDAPLQPAGPPATALVAERHAHEAGVIAGAVVLRFGAFLSPDSEQTLLQLAMARRGLSPWATRPDGHLPTVWIEDAAAAVVAALGVPAGTYNVADDDPPTRAAADAALAALVGRRRLSAPAAPLVRRLPALRATGRSLRVSNRRLRETGAWSPGVRAGLDGWRLVAEAQAAGSGRIAA